MKQIGWIFLLVLIWSCTDKASVGKEQSAVELQNANILKIVFKLHGDDIGSPEARSMMTKVASAIVSSGAGEILSSGFGMGSMEIVVKTKDEKSVMKIKSLLAENYPDSSFTIKPFDVSEGRGIIYK